MAVLSLPAPLGTRRDAYECVIHCEVVTPTLSWPTKCRNVIQLARLFLQLQTGFLTVKCVQV